MPGLAADLAKLNRLRRRWSDFAESLAPDASHAGPTIDLVPVKDFGSNPGALRMWTYVPETLRPSPPLVVVLHGCTQTAAGFAEGAGWPELADRHGFVLLLPEQTSANNPKSCFNWFLPGDTARGAGEALSIRQGVERACLDHGCDRSRVFVTGLSAGGAMAAELLAAYPDVFAAGGIVAGLPAGAASNVQEALGAMFKGVSKPAAAWGDKVRAASPHRGAWPRVSIWHGDADRTVIPANADELVKQWTDVHGVSLGSGARERVDGQVRAVWRDRAGREVVESVTIAGMAHGAPLATGEGPDKGGRAGPFMLEAGIWSSRHIARFFGVTDVTVAAAAPARRTPSAAPSPERARTAPPPRPGVRGAAPPPAIDVADVIQKALRSAGLFKR